jgi:hypothetical protein
VRRARGAVLAGLILLGCAPVRYHMPSSLQSYAYFVSGSDSLSVALGAALRRHGLVVLPALRGGGGPTAAVIHFVMRETDSDTARVLHVRLADTRTGAIVGGASVRLDALPEEVGARAEAVLDSLGLGRRAHSQL